MGRIRCIKPEFPQSESIGALTRDARLLFIQLWTLVDDEGRTRGNSRMLASLLYPYDADAGKLMEGWLKELEDSDHIRRYVVDSHTYLEVLNWLNHQKIDRPSISKLPPFDESSRVLAKVSVGREGKGREGIKEGEAPEAFVLPDWIPIPVWEDWLDVRKKKRAVNTPHALRLAVDELEKLRQTGESPVGVINQSILRGYTGLFPIKQNGNGNSSLFKPNAQPKPKILSRPGE